MLIRVLPGVNLRTVLFITVILSTFALLLALFHSLPVYAAECASVETTVISCDSQASGDEQTSGIWSLLLIGINILTAGVGVLAVGGFVYAGILWTTAEDKADQLNQAKNTILNTCIGLVSFGLMYSLLQFVVPGGVFNSIAAPRTSISKQNDLNPGQEGNGEVGDTSDSNGASSQADGGSTKETQLKVATYNVLGFDHDTSASKYSNNERMQRAGRLLKGQGVEIAVLNEINSSAQRNLILGELSGWKGTSLASSNQDVVIIWDASKFKLEKSGTYSMPVLVDKPERPAPWVRLTSKASGRTVFVFGLHLSLDDANQKTGANLALNEVKQRRSKNSVLIVAGDMNSNDRSDPVTYNAFKASGMLLYARDRAKSKAGDSCDTHHPLGVQECRSTRGSHIDQIWASNDQSIVTESYAAIATQETAHISDHNPVIVKFRVPPSK